MGPSYGRATRKKGTAEALAKLKSKQQMNVQNQYSGYAMFYKIYSFCKMTPLPFTMTTWLQSIGATPLVRRACNGSTFEKMPSAKRYMNTMKLLSSTLVVKLTLQTCLQRNTSPTTAFAPFETLSCLDARLGGV